jgi:hypothetical protein
MCRVASNRLADSFGAGKSHELFGYENAEGHRTIGILFKFIVKWGIIIRDCPIQQKQSVARIAGFSYLAIARSRQ